MNSMSEPPTELDFESLVNQVEEDIVAAEKIRLIETVNELGRNNAEKNRRDLRAGAV